MATETLISPGVLARENDQTFISKGPVEVGAAIIGPTVKGPVEVPTIVTSFSEFVNTFGTTFNSGSTNDSDTYTYFTSIAAYNYFINGGKSLLVARVVSGSYTPATSSIISNAYTSASFVLETISKGTIMNSTSTEISGALASGSSDNIRWEIVSSNTSSGTFGLLIRRGDDNNVTKTVLETWNNLSLDPNSPNYVSRVIGDQVRNYNSVNNQIEVSGSYPNFSSYVTVKAVNYKTLNYFDNNGLAKAQYTSSIPVNGSGSFGSATGTIGGGANFYHNINSTNTQGLVGANYNNMINLLANSNDYKFNVLITPGLYDAGYASQISSIISNTEDRGDNIFILDPVAYNSNVATVVNQASSRNTSYAAAYWPWVMVKDPNTGNNVWVPASTVLAGVYAYTDNVSAPWFAPAGNSRGGLSQVIRPEQKLSTSNRDTLYNGKVNPIAEFLGKGTLVYGNKTLQTKSSALDRVNVRRLLIELKSHISQIADNLVFEQNTNATRNQFLSQVNPYLASVQQRQGVYAFQVKMDDSNNTSDVIDRNELRGAIYLQPTRTSEFIYLDFNIQPTSVTFG